MPDLILDEDKRNVLKELREGIGKILEEKFGIQKCVVLPSRVGIILAIKKTESSLRFLEIFQQRKPNARIVDGWFLRIESDFDNLETLHHLVSSL